MIAIVFYGLLMFACGYGAAMLISLRLTQADIALPEAQAPSPIAEDEPTEAFVVAGKPKRSWRQRRKELEAASRTKRKAREEWRD